VLKVILFTSGWIALPGLCLELLILNLRPSSGSEACDEIAGLAKIGSELLNAELVLPNKDFLFFGRCLSAVLILS
jgi:hypothetical protein